MEFEHIIRLIREVSDSALTAFRLEEGNLHLSLEKFPESAFTAGKEREQKKEREITTELFHGEIEDSRQTQLDSSSLKSAVLSVQEENLAEKKEELPVAESLKSPLVGTFYNAPSPEEKPFVQIGDAVKKGQVLGIIEAMKLMNEIESEFDGVVEEILVENEQMVEYGQELFRIRKLK